MRTIKQLGKATPASLLPLCESAPGTESRSHLFTQAEIDALEAKLIKARQIKQGMMQELLTGRIRLV